MNPNLESRTLIETPIQDTSEMLHVQEKSTELSGEKQPMTLQEVVSKMHWIQLTQKKAS